MCCDQHHSDVRKTANHRELPSVSMVPCEVATFRYLCDFYDAFAVKGAATLISLYGAEWTVLTL